MGGDAKLVTVPKDITLPQLRSKLGGLMRSGRGCVIKYQLPGTDLDELVELEDDDDLELFREEHDELLEQAFDRSNSRQRLRVFLVPARASFSGDSGYGYEGSELSFQADTLSRADTLSVRSDGGGSEYGDGVATPREPHTPRGEDSFFSSEASDADPPRRKGSAAASTASSYSDLPASDVPKLLSEIDTMLGEVCIDDRESPSSESVALPSPSPAAAAGGGTTNNTNAVRPSLAQRSASPGGLKRPAGLMPLGMQGGGGGGAGGGLGLQIDVGGSGKLQQGKWDTLGNWSPASAESVEMPPTIQRIPAADIELLQELGRGSFGSVWLGQWRGIDVAVKELHSANSATPEGQNGLRDLYKEAETLASLHHPAVVTFYGITVGHPHPGTVMEYLCSGSLKKALPKLRARNNLRLMTVLALDAARGMEYLHSRKLIHFDLKADNLLCDLRDLSRPVVKVSDFGLAKLKAQSFVSGNMRGTLPWMAPELFPSPHAGNQGSQYQADRVTEKVDVYSFGVVLWEIWTGGAAPFADVDVPQIFGGLMSGTLKLAVPEDCDATWRALMQACWASEPWERPTFSYICQQLDILLRAVQSR